LNASETRRKDAAGRRRTATDTTRRRYNRASRRHGALTVPVHIVEDDPAVRESLSMLFTERGHAVEVFADAGSFLSALDGATTGCVILDLNLPDMNGIDLLRHAGRLAPDLGFVVLTGRADVRQAVEAMQLGAIDFVEKPAPPERLFAAVAQARPGRRHADPVAMARIDRLTRREHEVMVLLVAGHTNKEIARRLGISPRTAEVHRRNAMRKTGSDSLAAAVRLAIAAGVEPPERS